MATRKLPTNPQEIAELAKEYSTCSRERLRELSKKYGFKNIDSFTGNVYKRLGFRRAKVGNAPTQVVIQGSKEPNVIDTGAPLNELEGAILKIVQLGPVSVGEVSRQIDRSSETVIKVIDSLRAKHYEVNLDETQHQLFIPQEPRGGFAPTEFKYFRKFYRIGLVSDTQIGSKYQQLTLLHDAYADFNKRKVDCVLHAGDLSDGVGLYAGQDVEVFMHDPYGEQQIKYICDNYPRLEGNRKTYFIGGQHDRSFYKRKGRNIIKAIAEGRKDLVSRGFFQHQFDFKNINVVLQHPGGGVAYARSYRPQKITENMVGFIVSLSRESAQWQRSLPHLIVFGHWHIPSHLPLYMGVDCISLPCFQSQTPYLAEKGLMPVVGYAIAELYLDENNNLTSTKVEFIIMNSQIKKDDWSL